MLKRKREFPTDVNELEKIILERDVYPITLFRMFALVFPVRLGAFFKTNFVFEIPITDVGMMKRGTEKLRFSGKRKW